MARGASQPGTWHESPPDGCRCILAANLGPIVASEARHQQRLPEPQRNLNASKHGQSLEIASSTLEMVRRRLQRLHTDPRAVLNLPEQGLSCDPAVRGRPHASSPALERVLDTNNLMGLRFFDQGLRVSSAVGRNQFRHPGDKTGFLVSRCSCCSSTPPRDPQPLGGTDPTTEKPIGDGLEKADRVTRSALISSAGIVCWS